jgi:hypothetical protein
LVLYRSSRVLDLLGVGHVRRIHNGLTAQLLNFTACTLKSIASTRNQPNMGTFLGEGPNNRTP